MKPVHTMIITALFFTIPSACLGRVIHINFDSYSEDTGPKGFTSYLTGRGKAGNWKILKDMPPESRRKILAQTEMDSTDYRFPLCIFDGIAAKNVEVSVMFKPLKGEEDRAAGIVWRFVDENNYYVARANALENNVVAYIVRDGKRGALFRGAPFCDFRFLQKVRSGSSVSRFSLKARFLS